jgi:hypothetical protein
MSAFEQAVDEARGELLRRIKQLLGPVGQAHKSGPWTPENLGTELARRWPALKGNLSQTEWIVKIRDLLQQEGLGSNGNLVSLDERDDKGQKTDSGLSAGSGMSLTAQPRLFDNLSDSEAADLMDQYSRILRQKSAGAALSMGGVNLPLASDRAEQLAERMTGVPVRPAEDVAELIKWVAEERRTCPQGVTRERLNGAAARLRQHAEAGTAPGDEFMNKVTSLCLAAEAEGKARGRRPGGRSR